MVNGNPAGTLPANWENKLVKKADLDTEKAKITTLKNDLGVIKNDNSIDTVRVNQIKDNEAELTRINNDIIAKIKTKTNLKTLIKLNANNKNEIDDVRLNEIETILSTPANTSAADVAKYKAKLQGLGIAAGYSDFNVMLADLNSLKTEKSDFQNKLSQQQEHCRKEKEAFQAQIEQKEQDLLKFMVEQLRLNLTGDKYERQQVLAEIQKLIVNPDTNQETTLANLRQKITEQEKEIKKLREQNKENIPTPELKQQAEKVLKELGLKNSYQTQIDKITSLSELTDFYQQAAKNEIGKVKGEKDQMRN
ncbi:2015_t:CDS:2 [Racocetra persica]|uniref:2015_t:CDS:1 n=1 Tax=Racocetra persica TaxID=160502 RepID=A0ACA9NSB9_9GLOM|nr:2015_t:CDS:2 [Racocetra persica]